MVSSNWEFAGMLPRSLHCAAGAPNCGAGKKPAASVGMTEKGKDTRTSKGKQGQEREQERGHGQEHGLSQRRREWMGGKKAPASEGGRYMG